jgi:hypothetical protein
MQTIACAVAALCGAAALAGEVVGVKGSSATYVTPIEANINGQNVPLRLTGTALRTKFVVNVYAIGSYLQQGVTVRSAEELAAANCFKRLHLILERDVEGRELAEAFRNSIRMNYPEPAFTDEVNALVAQLQQTSVRKGDQVWLTHIPDTGLHVTVQGKATFVIHNVAFSRAVWEIYLGRNNLGDAIKAGLTSRL